MGGVRVRRAAVLAIVGLVSFASLQVHGSYYPFAAGMFGAGVVALALGVLFLGYAPPMLTGAAGGALGILGVWAAVSPAWGGLPYVSWRFLGLSLTGAAAMIVGSAVGPYVRTVIAGLVAGLATHAVLALVILGVAEAPSSWFQARQFEGAIGYHNAEGVAMAIGVPLALMLGVSAAPWVRAAGAGASVVLLSVALLTQSRGTLAAIVLVVAVQTVLVRRFRLAALAGLVASAGVVLFVFLRSVDRALLDNAVADDRPLRIYVLVAFGLAALVSLASFLELRAPSVNPRLVQRLTVGAAVAIVLVAAGGVAYALTDGGLRERLTAEPNSPSQVVGGDTRLSSFSPTGRVLQWRVALGMVADDPVLGAGGGVFPRRWGIERDNKDAYVLQPHSIQMEVAAEFGGIGLVLLLAFVVFSAWTLVRGLRLDRAVGAAAIAGFSAFLMIASVDWTFSFPALLVIACVIVGATGGRGPRRVPGIARSAIQLAIGLAVVGVLVGPAVSANALEDGRRYEARDDLVRAAERARYARGWGRWDPDVVSFQGLIAERSGHFERAADLYARAAELSQQPWLDTYREARAARRAGLDERSRDACRRAHASNPLEPELWRGVCEGVVS